MQFPSSFRPLLLATILLGACDRTSEKESRADASQYEFPSVDAIEQREDGLTYLKGSNAPYHGPVIRTHPERGLRYFAMYQNGMLNGPEITFYDNGLIRRITDFRDGEKDRNRDYYENGNPWRDAMFDHDVAWGRHLKWHENGRLGFVGVMHQDEDSIKWHGHITDHDENGELVVDAIFDEGRYIGGVFPLEKTPKPKPSGKQWLWED
jgi:antitoxin component YwqK of YwqJK toxin-antitoxin module